MTARIIFGVKPPKNWKENLKKQKDEKYQAMARQYDKATSQEEKQSIVQQINEYWAKRRVELGFTEPPED